MVDSVLASSALALRDAGHREMSRRAAGAVARLGRSDYWAQLFPDDFDTPTLFLDPDLPDVEPDQVLDEIVEFADELDRVGR